MSRSSRRIRIVVSYDGSEFSGWQVQPAQLTIQSAIEEVLRRVVKHPVAIHGSGRTDAGVHAYAQVAAFNLENAIPCDNLRRAMNHLLPPSIRILSAEDVAHSFHPRYDAVGKEYEYRIWREELCPPFICRYVHHHPYPLDEAAMIAAARLYEGEHDFSSFAAADEKDALGRSKIRHISSSILRREGEMLIYRVYGSGFLKHMVRNLVGTLIEVGRGNLSHIGLKKLLTHPDRAKSGATVPGQGLFLVRVDYAD